MFKRKIMALVLALSAMLSVTATAHAEDTTEARETVRIGKYDCWVEDGEYYTELDGEVGLVIDVDKFYEQPYDGSAMPLSDITWDFLESNAKIDISDGREYQGVINLNNYDDYTPVFLIDTGDTGFASVKLSTKFVFVNEYKMTFYLYDGTQGKWNYPYTQTVRFAGLKNYVLLVSGTQTRDITRCCAFFHKDGSTGESVFNYWVKGVK